MYCALLFAMPPAIRFGGLILVSVVLIPVIVGGIVYARGAWRAFWIGCATGASPMAWYFAIGAVAFIPVYQGQESHEFRYMLAGCHLLTLVDGVVVVIVRWICVRQSKDKGVANRTEQG